MAGCSCGSGTAYSKCCKPYIDGSLQAPTAELLMRSRYSAYAKGAIDYILDTHHPDSRDEISRESTEEWAKDSEWMGLEILNVSGGTETDDEGIIEFTARYRGADRAIVNHHESSTFLKKDGRWYFSDAKMVNNPQTRESPKVGRNDPCPCGSGKKYKKCCGS
jgi:SEC-C motif-containing protein